MYPEISVDVSEIPRVPVGCPVPTFASALFCECSHDAVTEKARALDILGER